MPSVAKPDRREAGQDTPMQVGVALAGRVHGKVVFRVTNCAEKPLKVVFRPGKMWIRDGWFTKNLLDE
jgi:hypothetical protein